MRSLSQSALHEEPKQRAAKETKLLATHAMNTVETKFTSTCTTTQQGSDRVVRKHNTNSTGSMEKGTGCHGQLEKQCSLYLQNKHD